MQHDLLETFEISELQKYFTHPKVRDPYSLSAFLRTSYASCVDPSSSLSRTAAP